VAYILTARQISATTMLIPLVPRVMPFYATYCQGCFRSRCFGGRDCVGLVADDAGPPPAPVSAASLYWQRVSALDRAIINIVSRDELAVLSFATVKGLVAHLGPKAKARLKPLRRNIRQRLREAHIRQTRLRA